MAAQGSQNPGVEGIALPEGFKIEVYTDQVRGARSLALGPENTVFVGTRDEGKVYAVLDENSDYAADRVITVAEGLNQPNGVAYLNGSLYVAEVDRVLRYENIINNLQDALEPEVVSSEYPSEEHHGWKFIRFGPDGRLYVPVGAPCNICESEDEIFASITALDIESGEHEIFARGIRNTVGFDWHPVTEELWFTDNGRDNLGEDIPSDELNRAPERGMHFGYPFCHGKSIPDPEFGNGVMCSDYTAPELELGPHVAALGMRFYTGEMFPEEYRGDIFIAEHGSWNREIPIGYRITRATITDSSAENYSVFAEGWLNGNDAWGRPVDILVMPDGSLLVSDDLAGTIYRITYSTLSS